MKRMIALVGIIIGTVAYGWAGIMPAHALQSFSMAPMNEKMVLSPGDTYESSLQVINASEDEDFYYKIDVEPYYVDEDYSPIFTNQGDKNRIVEWITVEDTAGMIKIGETKEIAFSINVPEDAPGGGQYAVISVASDPSKKNDEGEGTVIGESVSLGHTIYAEIIGESVTSGEVEEMVVPSMRFGDKIMAKSRIKNTGNVHSEAIYRMKVYSLFSSDTPVYDSEQYGLSDADKADVLPDRTYTHETYWDNTPMIGVYNVEYTVEFQGQTLEKKAVVFVCPWWVIFIVLVGVALLIIRIISLMRWKKVEEELKTAKKSEKPIDKTLML